jgi:hypothetical protein
MILNDFGIKDMVLDIGSSDTAHVSFFSQTPPHRPQTFRLRGRGQNYPSRKYQARPLQAAS